MVRIRDYRQDETKPFGVGEFEFDDGTTYYLDDPERARSVLEDLYGPSSFADDVNRESTNIAERGSVDRKGSELDTRQRYENAVAKLAGAPEPNEPFRGIDTGPSLLRRAVAGPGGGEDTVSREPLESRAAPEPNMSVDPGPEPPVKSPEERLLERAQRAVPPDKQVRGVDPRRMAAQGVPVPTKVTSEGGLPAAEYASQFEGRARAYLDEGEVLARHQAEDQAAANLRIAELHKRGLDMQEANKARAVAVAQAEEKYKADRDWLEKDVETFFDKSKPDPDRLFKERGVFGNIAVAVAQFMGAYAAVITNTPNFAAQILDKKIDRDVDAQLEAFRRGKMKRDGQLARMAERGMSIGEMKHALTIQQDRAVDMMMKEAAEREGTRESLQAYEALRTARQSRFIDSENKYRTEALGKQTVQSDIVQPSAGGSVPLTPTEYLEAQGRYVKAERELGYQLAGGEHAERAEERALKADEAQQKRGDAVTSQQQEYGKQRMKVAPAAEEAQAAKDKLLAIKEKYGHLPGVGTWDVLGPNTPLGEQRQRFLQAFGVDQAEAAGEVQQLLKIIEGAAVRANAGTQTEGDVKREAEAMRGPNQDEAQILSGVERLTERAVSPLRELDAAYEAVRPSQQAARDRVLLEKARKARELREAREREEEKNRGGR